MQRIPLRFIRLPLTKEERDYHIQVKFSVKNQSGNIIGELVYVDGGGWLYQEALPHAGSIQLEDMRDMVEFCQQQDEMDNDDPGYEPPNCYIPGEGWVVM